MSRCDLWPCGRATERFKGAYPKGMIRRIDENIVSLNGNLVLHQFGGGFRSDDHNHTVDINPDTNPTFVCDARSMDPVPDNMYDVVIADPPYDSQNINYSKKLYDCDEVAPYSFVDAGLRVLKPGGYYMILHQLVYKTPTNARRMTVIGITTGPNMRIRVLNVFQKKESLEGFV